jgi:hypothetical protein
MVGIAVRHGRCVHVRSANRSTASNASVEGRVLHEPGGEPIRKVVVRFLARDADARVFAATATENGLDAAEAMEVFSIAGSEGVDERLKYSAGTDAEGRFKFEKVPPGTYIVSISRAGYVPVESKPRRMTITAVEGQNLRTCFTK